MKLSEIKLVIKNVKPRNTTHRTLASKVNAAGAHRDRKAELKKGQQKHKGALYDEVQLEDVNVDR